MAARQGNLRTVRHLIDEGTDVNVKDDDGVRIQTYLYTDLSLNYPNRIDGNFRGRKLSQILRFCSYLRSFSV